GLPELPLLARGAGAGLQALLPRLGSLGCGAGRRGPLPRTRTGGHLAFRRMGQGAARAFRRRRHLRPDLRGEVSAQMGRRPLIHRSPMPGLGLSMGITLTMLSIVVLLPIGALLLRGAAFGLDGIWDTVNR